VVIVPSGSFLTPTVLFCTAGHEVVVTKNPEPTLRRSRLACERSFSRLTRRGKNRPQTFSSGQESPVPSNQTEGISPGADLEFNGRAWEFMLVLPIILRGEGSSPPSSPAPGDAIDRSNAAGSLWHLFANRPSLSGTVVEVVPLSSNLSANLVTRSGSGSCYVSSGTPILFWRERDHRTLAPTLAVGRQALIEKTAVRDLAHDQVGSHQSEQLLADALISDPAEETDTRRNAIFEQEDFSQ